MGCYAGRAETLVTSSQRYEAPVLGLRQSAARLGRALGRREVLGWARTEQANASSRAAPVRSAELDGTGSVFTR